MNTEDKYDLLMRFLKKCCFSVDLNMNDTFGYACAESYNMSMDELEFVLHIYDKYSHDGLNAFASVRSGQEVIKPLKTDQYLKAKKLIIKHLSMCGQCNAKLDPVNDDDGVHMHLMNGGSLIRGSGFMYLCVDCALKKGI